VRAAEHYSFGEPALEVELQKLGDETGKTETGRIWAYVRDDQPFG
jgi:hypothetical protein